MAAYESGGAEARIDIAVLTLARIIGWRIAREEVDRFEAENYNLAGKRKTWYFRPDMCRSMIFVTDGAMRTLGDEVKPLSEVTEAEMARAEGLDPKKFRTALRKECFRWHVQGEKWTVRQDGPEHRAMKLVLNRLLNSA